LMIYVFRHNFVRKHFKIKSFWLNVEKITLKNLKANFASNVHHI
jgi:hypothetical protein